MYHVQHYAYCGMSGLRHTFETEGEARDYVAERIRGYRASGYPVVCLDRPRGREWEIQEPEDCAMVPDACGTLHLTRETFECRECGSKHDTCDAAAACCASD